MNLERFNKAMGAAIRQERLLKGMTQQELGKALAIRYQQISKFESGVNSLSAHQLALVAKKLGVTIAELYERAGAKYQPDDSADAPCIMALRYLRMLPRGLQERMVAGIRAMAFAKEVV